MSGFISQAIRNFQSLGKHFHVPRPSQACTPWPEGGGRPAALSGQWLRRSGHRGQPEPGRRASSGRTLGGARRAHSGTGPAAPPLLRPRFRSRSRPSAHAPRYLQPAVTVKPTHPHRPPPLSPVPRRRTASYTTAGGLRLPTRPRAQLERAQKVRLPRPGALALLCWLRM